MKLAVRVVLCAACMAASPVAWGQAASSAPQAYPVRPVRLIVPGAPGGLTDLGARTLAPGLAALLGQPVVVDSRAGAAGMIACDLVAKAAPDGHTFLFGFSGPLVIVPSLNESTPYDTVKDFAPVSLVATSPYVLVVNPALAAKSVKDLVALAKSRPGKLNYGSGGIGTGIHLSAELFNMAAGVNIVHVTYKAATPALTAVMAGEVEMMFVGVSQALPQLKAGRARALAVGGEKRNAMIPDVPTLTESGYPIDASGWYGVLAPRNTPRAIVARVHGALGQVLKDAQVVQRFSDNGFVVEYSTPERFGEFLRREMATWRKVVDAAGLKGKGTF